MLPKAFLEVFPKVFPQAFPQVFTETFPGTFSYVFSEALPVHPFFIPSFPVQGFKNNQAVTRVHRSRFETIFGYLKYCWQWTFYGR